MSRIVQPDPDGNTPHPREFGPGHPYWPCPICAGLRPSSVSPLLQAKHIEHTMVEPALNERLSADPDTARALAWDEGYAAAELDALWRPYSDHPSAATWKPTPNPYRTALGGGDL